MAAAAPALSSLVDLTKSVLTELNFIGAGTWNADIAARCQNNLERVVDSAANLEQAPLHEPALDLYAYLGVFAEGTLAPNAQQRQELLRLCTELRRALTQCAPQLMPTKRDAVYVLATELTQPKEISAHFEQEGFGLRWFSEGDAFAEALREQTPIAVLADAALLQSVGEMLDLAAARQLESIHVPLVGISADSAGTGSGRLKALISGADLFAPDLDDPTLAKQIRELVSSRVEEPFRVLIVDDDRSMGDYCETILRRAGMETKSVLEAHRVLSTVRSFKPDLVLMDLYMPKQDGMSLTQELRQHAESLVLPIVFLSGEHSEDARFQAIQAGGDDFLTKPIRPRHLIAAVRSRIKRVRTLGRQISSPAESSPGGQVRRGSFLSSLRDCLSLSPSSGVTVLCAIGVDQIEMLDRDLGLAGKHALEQALAQRLLQLCGDLDTLCLWQEFNFGLLLRECQSSRIANLTEQLRQAIHQQPLKLHNQDTTLSISIGIAPQPRTAEGGIDPWISSAFAALGIAQRLGGNRVEGLLSDDDELPPEKMLWLRELLKQASQGSGVGSEFQPLVPLRGQDPGHYALLLYLRDRRQPLGGVPRAEYLRVARDLGVLPQIERIALFRALEALDDQRSHNLPANVLVPLDLASFDRKLLDWLEKEMKRRCFQGQTLSLEFDAETLLQRPALLGVVKRLRQSGLQVLATERSGRLQVLTDLQTLPLDGLRLPITTLMAIPAEILAPILEHWRQGNRIVIVDGVNEVNLLANLWNMGVDYLQGDAVAAPGPRLDFDFSEIHA